MQQIRWLVAFILHHARKSLRRLLVAWNALWRLIKKRVFDPDESIHEGVHTTFSSSPSTCSMPTSSSNRTGSLRESISISIIDTEVSVDSTLISNANALDTDYVFNGPTLDHGHIAIPSNTISLGNFTDLSMMLPSETQRYERVVRA